MSDKILIRDSEMVACENKLPSFYFEYLLIKNGGFWRTVWIALIVVAIQEILLE